MIVRTGVDEKFFLKKFHDHPLWLNVTLLRNLLEGELNTLASDKTGYLLQRWQSLPAAKGRIKIPDSVRRMLEREQERTGLGAHGLLKGTRESRPEGLSGQVVNGWLTGKTRTAKPGHLEYVLKLWMERPDCIELTPERLREIRELADSTGLNPWKLIRMCRDDEVPEGLYPAVIHKWLEGEAETARRDHIEFALRRWRKACLR